MSKQPAAATLVLALTLSTVSVVGINCTHALTIDMVPVGNPGNTADNRPGLTGMGSVGYRFSIGKYEITAGQYTEFLNAVAKSDPNGLYNSQMGETFGFEGANIKRNGLAPDFRYSVASDYANRPVNYVSFWDTVRFANWLHNGQPTGPQGPGTTEGGAYINVGNQATFARQPGARFFIPTENEWYKAAYHNSSAGPAASYFNYPTGTDFASGRDMTEVSKPGNNANYRIPAVTPLLIGGPYYRTLVGEFELSKSPYGTFDQGGNVWEWTESTAGNSSLRVRGGSYWDLGDAMAANGGYATAEPASDSKSMGFRIASVPEPSALVLLALGICGMLILCRSI
jgi:formylglycine-generating enzyme